MFETSNLTHFQLITMHAQNSDMDPVPINFHMVVIFVFFFVTFRSIGF